MSILLQGGAQSWAWGQLWAWQNANGAAECCDGIGDIVGQLGLFGWQSLPSGECLQKQINIL